MKEWRVKHPQEIKEYNRKWRLNNSDKRKEIDRKFRESHPYRVREWIIQHPERMRILKRRNNSKRRGLGNIELNKIFKGSHGHHVDKEHILYIPADIHNSVYHNIWNGEGMKKINDLAFKWIALQENFSFSFIENDILKI